MRLILYDNSKLTVELREIVESGVNIWDFDYPTYYHGDEKKAFEQKVIDHFYFRQIGQETPARWLHYFRSRIREIMPYYIQLYESEHIQDNVDPFDNYLLEETFERTVTDNKNRNEKNGLTQTATGENTGTHTQVTHSNVDTKTDGSEDKLSKVSDTPQGSIENLDEYMSGATKEDNAVKNHSETVTALGMNEGNTDTSSSEVKSDEEREQTETSNQTETYHIYRHGNIGVQTFGDELQKYRDVMLNIDMMVINELNDLFLGVY